MVLTIEDNFEPYINSKSESDYWIENQGVKIPTQATIVEPHIKDFIKHDLEKNVSIFKQEFIDVLSPDNIDINEFWKVATDNFPLFSIAGGIQNITTIDEANIGTNKMARILGVLDSLFIRFLLDKNPRVLEIGPGYGGIQQIIALSPVGDGNYYAIDVNPLFDHPRLFKCDGRNIPDMIPNDLDVVYSMNVFQHLSKNQRSSYYRQIYDRLVSGGVFLFGMFVVTDGNKDKPFWGNKDENGRCYTVFFRQLTLVDTEEEIMTELAEIGFFVKKLSQFEEHTNYLTFECIK